MKTNTSQNQPLHVTFDYITLHDAMARRVTNFCPSPSMRASLDTVPAPGAWQTNESPSFGVVSNHPIHGSWTSGIYIGREFVGEGVHCVLDGEGKWGWKGLRKRIEDNDAGELARMPADYMARFRAINPSIGFVAVMPRPSLLKYPDEWASFTMLQYLLHWNFKRVTTELTNSGRLMI
jgi:hypothetical protein